jgi:hypothetical protein
MSRALHAFLQRFDAAVNLASDQIDAKGHAPFRIRPRFTLPFDSVLVRCIAIVSEDAL